MFVFVLTGTKYQSDTKCKGFLRHKQFICSPEYLLRRGVDVYTYTQKPGDYVIIKPGVIHFGFNSGDNTAEAVNFALKDHVDVELADGPGYSYCLCESGLRSDGELRTNNSCDTGYSTGVAELHEVDMKMLGDGFGVGMHKLGQRRKAKRTHWEKRKNRTHHQ